VQILPVARGAGEVTLGRADVDVDVDEHNFHSIETLGGTSLLMRGSVVKVRRSLPSLLFTLCSDIVFLFTLAAFVSSKLQLILECNLIH